MHGIGIIVEKLLDISLGRYLVGVLIDTEDLTVIHFPVFEETVSEYSEGDFVLYSIHSDFSVLCKVSEEYVDSLLNEE